MQSLRKLCSNSIVVAFERGDIVVVVVVAVDPVGEVQTESEEEEKEEGEDRFR